MAAFCVLQVVGLRVRLRQAALYYDILHETRVRSDAWVCLRYSAVHLRYEQGFAAVDRFVKSDTKVGLGTGSTAAFVVQRLGELLRDGKLKNVVGVPTSEATRKLAEKWNIPLVSLNDLAEDELLDVCIDGADEVLLPELLLIKGRGGALLREKIVAAASKTFVVVGDSSKVIEESRGMGLTGALPVEVISFFSRHVQRGISALPTVRNCCSRITIRRVSQQQQQKQQQQQDQKTPHPSSPQHLMKNNEDMNYYVTDNGNHIVDLFFEKPIADPHALNRDLLSVIGVVETGLFLNMTSSCVIAYPDGSLQTLQPAAAAATAK